VNDVKLALGEVIGVKPSDIVLTTVSQGRITAVHKGSNHVMCLTTGPIDTIVAYVTNSLVRLT